VKCGPKLFHQIDLLFSRQMRLCLATKDYIRTQIISKKISIRFFEQEEHHNLKLKFYQYMIELDQVPGSIDTIKKKGSLSENIKKNTFFRLICFTYMQDITMSLS
jgi:26S proteasome regulatory subunit N5